MKRFLGFCTVLIIMVLLVSCVSQVTPIDENLHEGYRWTAQEADVYFDVSERYVELCGCTTNGVAVANGKSYNIIVSASYNGTLSCYTGFRKEGNNNYYSDKDIILSGKIKDDNKEKFTLDVKEEYQSFFGEEIKTLTFVREPTRGYVEYVKPE